MSLRILPSTRRGADLHVSHRRDGLVRRVTAGTVGIAIVFGLAACGGDDDSGDSTESTGNGSGDTSITHQYGTTDVPDNPENVVVSNSAWRDALVALDVPFTLSVHWSKTADAPWEEGTSDVEEVDYNDATDFPVEKIASAAPDVILGVPVGEPELYDQLDDIAPSVGTIGTSVDDWREVLTLAGQIFDKEDEASELEQDFDDKVSAFRDDNPGLEGKTFTFTALIQDQVWAVANREDPLNVFFTDLGMEISPTILDLPDEGGSGRVEISLENLDLLDSDAIIHQGNDEVLSDVSGWSDLPAVENDTAVYLDPNPLNQPSILSQNWALEHLGPELKKIAEL